MTREEGRDSCRLRLSPLNMTRLRLPNMAAPYKLPELSVEEFAAQFESTNPNECWIWKGKKDKAGYGYVRFEHRTQRIHRVAFKLFRGEIPAGMQLDHLCHTNSNCGGGVSCPHRPCGNPDHLEVVTLLENVMRGQWWASENRRKTQCDKGHPLVQTSSGRRCIPCSRELSRRSSARYYAKKRAERAEPLLEK